MKTADQGKRNSWLISAVIVLAVTLWLLSGLFGNDDSETSPAAQRSEAAPTEVRVRQLSAEDVIQTVTVNGKTEPARIVNLAAETSGRVVSIHANRGARVNAGEVIASLDKRDREARLTQAAATVRQRETEYEARERLKDQSYVSEAQLEEAIALLEAARAEFLRAELDMDHMLIRAPFDGALLERNVEVGDYLTPGDPVAEFVDERTLIVSANVSEFDAPYISAGSSGSAKLATGEIINGTIRYVAPVADTATRTFTVELEFDNSEGLYRGGTTAELIIPTKTVRAHQISPSLLTLDNNGNIGVKVVNEQNQVEFYLADIAVSANDGMWVSGLPEEISLITVGQGYVNEGAVVEPVPETQINSAVAEQLNSGAQ